LRSGCGFEELSQEELASLAELKIGHGRAWAGELIADGVSPTPRCYTLFSGWAVRCRVLPGGQQQVIDILLPGDTIGLEAVLCGVPNDLVEAVTDVTFCILDASKVRDTLWQSSVRDRVARILAWQNLHLANRLAVAGACSARANLAYLMCDLYARLDRRRMTQGTTFKLPLSLKQLAEVIGLTPVHLHRILQAMRKDGLLFIENKTVTIPDLDALAQCGASWTLPARKMPLL